MCIMPLQTLLNKEDKPNEIDSYSKGEPSGQRVYSPCTMEAKQESYDKQIVDKRNDLRSDEVFIRC